MRVIIGLLLGWLAFSPAFADSGFVAPTATGTAATGQIPGTTTNDSPTAGNVGEYQSSTTTQVTQTVTITNASPGVFTATAHGLNIGSGLNLTTSGGLPTGLSVGTNYWVCSSTFAANTFTVATSVANALAGTCVNTSSAGSGTHTAISTILLANAAGANITGISLTAGNWLCAASSGRIVGATTTMPGVNGGISATTATLPTAGSAGYASINSSPTGAGIFYSVPPINIKIASTTTYFLVALDVFGISTNAAYGSIICWRVR